MPSICSCYIHALSYAQSAITTSQRAHEATIEILFAKKCNHKIFLGEHASDPPRYVRYVDFGHTTMKQLATALFCVSKNVRIKFLYMLKLSNY